MPDIPLNQFVSPMGFILFGLWWMLTLYCVSVCQRHPNIPVEFRQWYNLLVLITGPWGLIVLLSRYRYPVYEAAAREYRDQVEGGPLTRWFRRLLGLETAHTPVESAVELCTSDGKPLHSLDVRYAKRNRGEDSEAINYIKGIFFDAVEAQATDVLIDPRSEELYSVRIRIDGMLEESDRISAALAQNILNCLKIASRLDIAERRRPQDGSFMVKLPEADINCRLATVGTVRGAKGAIRILDQRMGLKPIPELGMSQKDQERLVTAMNRNNGMILVCGPTGSGKTTTLYAILQHLDAQARNLVTIEDPIEYPLEYATQTEINERAGITFASGLRSMLRQNPDVILIGEVRDQETAEMVIQASNTGHLVLTTVHGNDSSAAIMRIHDLGVPIRRLSGAVSAVLSQRLIRKLCPHCKERNPLSQEERALLAEHNLHITSACISVGCELCRQTGYSGREGIFELLFVNREIDEVMSTEPSLSELRAVAIRSGMVPMLTHGLQKVASGITTIEEILRVSNEAR